MSKSLWLITLSPKITLSTKLRGTATGRVTVKARTCDEQNGALVFRGGSNLSIKAIG
jgi:hypothetical protein